MKVYAWLIDFAHFWENCPTGIIPEWMQKVTQHSGIIQYTFDSYEVQGMDPNYTHPLFAPNYTHFWKLFFSETVQPNSAWSNLAVSVVLILSMKEN